MFAVGYALAKTLAKSHKVTFWSKKNGFGCFFLAHCCGCSKNPKWIFMTSKEISSNICLIQLTIRIATY